MIDVHGAGPRAVGRYRAGLRGFVPYLDVDRAESRSGERLLTGASEAVGGSVAQIIYGRVIDGQASVITKTTQRAVAEAHLAWGAS
jgi:hypothetical protein